MLLGYFTEQPFSGYPDEEARRAQPTDHPARRAGDTVLLFSNRFFDANHASRLYRERLEQYKLVEQVGFDAIMTNEHHNSAFCMQHRCNMISMALAVTTKHVKILQLGNPLPLWDNPVQLAEEIAMVDLFSEGRVVAGIVRGGGAEQLANNINPVRNRSRFIEAHDLLIKIWTEPGPFSWHGEEYDLRVVNPWALPLQQPHPRVFVPGVASMETITFAAEHAYPYICLGTTFDETDKIAKFYAQEASRSGFDAGPEHLGYVMRCHVADTEERALENARQFLWMQGEFTGVGHPVWSGPTGYSTWESRMARKARTVRLNESLPDLMDKGVIVAGTVTQVIDRIATFLHRTRVGTLILWANDGNISATDSLRCIELLGNEVLPHVREIAKELALLSPFEARSPVSLAAMQAAAP